MLKTLIFGGAIVKLFNRQSDSFLCYDIGKRPGFKRIESTEDLSKTDSSALWIIEGYLAAWAGACLFSDKLADGNLQVK